MIHLNTRKIVVLFFSIFVLTSCVNSKETTLEDFLKTNNQTVKNYLMSLDDNKINKLVDGVLLSDDSLILKDFVFLKKTYEVQTKTHIYLFKESPDKHEVAFIWVDADGQPFQLSDCVSKNQLNPAWAGGVLSGDVHTYSSVNPGGNIVTTHCTGALFNDQI